MGPGLPDAPAFLPAPALPPVLRGLCTPGTMRCPALPSWAWRAHTCRGRPPARRRAIPPAWALPYRAQAPGVRRTGQPSRVAQRGRVRPPGADLGPVVSCLLPHTVADSPLLSLPQLNLRVPTAPRILPRKPPFQLWSARQAWLVLRARLARPAWLSGRPPHQAHGTLPAPSSRIFSTSSSAAHPGRLQPRAASLRQRPPPRKGHPVGKLLPPPPRMGPPSREPVETERGGAWGLVSRKCGPRRWEHSERVKTVGRFGDMERPREEACLKQDGSGRAETGWKSGKRTRIALSPSLGQCPWHGDPFWRASVGESRRSSFTEFGG